MIEAVGWLPLRAGRTACEAEFALPSRVNGWVIVGRGVRSDLRAAVDAVVPSLHAAGLATLTVDLPLRARPAVAWVRTAARTVRADLAGGLPLAYLGAGPGAGAGWAASIHGELDGVLAWNGRPLLAGARPHRVTVPSLLMIDADAAMLYRRLLFARGLSRRLGGAVDLELVNGPEGVDAALVGRWFRERLLTPAAVVPVRRGRLLVARRRLVRAGAAIAFAPALGAIAAPATATALPEFSKAAAKKLPAAAIAGDTRQIATSASRAAASTAVAAHELKREQREKRLQAARILGDTSSGLARPFATGSVAPVDGAGMKWFINTNITFSTSSSASGGMSEASFTHSVSASTLNGGVVQSRLNDSYDGYESLCVSNNNLVNAPCATGNGNFDIYNKDGAPTVDSSCTAGENVVFNPQTIATGVTLSRKVFVPSAASGDSFARWLDVVDNTSASPVTITLVTGNNLGSDSNTKITGDSAGDTTPTTSDTWATTFQNFAGAATTTSDPRLGHIFGNSGAAVGLAGIFFQNGNDRPYWGYTLTVPAGGTQIVMNYGVAKPSIAASEAKSAELVSVADPHQLDCMSAAEQGEVVNFSLAPSADPYAFTTVHDAALGEPAGTLFGSNASNHQSVLVSGPAHAASFSLNADGSFSYTPAPGFGGTDSFTYENKNAAGQISSTATVTLTVTGVAPAFTSASTASFSVGTAGSFTITTSGIPNAAISDGTPLPSGLSFKDNGDGTATISGTPAPGTHGTYAIALTAANGQGSNAGQQLTLNIAGMAPSFTSASTASFTVGTAASFTITTGGEPAATITDGTPLPSGLSFKDNGDGTATISGTPAPGTHGTYAITLTAANGLGTNATQQLAITINTGVTPTAAAHSYRTLENRTLSVTAPGLLGESYRIVPLTAVLVTAPSHGTATVDPDGGFTYTPRHGVTGTDTFTYSTVDPDGVHSAPATVTIAIAGPAGEFARIKRSLDRIVASEERIARSTSQILAGVTDPAVIKQVDALLARAAALIAKARRAEHELSSHKLNAGSVAGISKARGEAALARKLAADARATAARARGQRHHGR